MNEDEIRALLHEINEEPIPAESLRRVRSRVDQRTQLRTWVRWWSAAGIAAAAACAVLLMLWWRQPVQIPQPATPLAVLKPAPLAHRIQAPRPLIHTAVRPAVRKPRSTTPNLVIRIETPDPDVVILLIGD